MCRWAKTNEVHAYEKLTELQGVLTPIFYGEYIYKSLNDGDPLIAVLILEYVGHTLLSDLLFSDFTKEELCELGIKATDTLNTIHGYGVCHNDIVLHNLMYSREDFVI